MSHLWRNGTAGYGGFFLQWVKISICGSFKFSDFLLGYATLYALWVFCLPLLSLSFYFIYLLFPRVFYFYLAMRFVRGVGVGEGKFRNREK